jgi:hypothetical protein
LSSYLPHVSRRHALVPISDGIGRPPGDRSSVYLPKLSPNRDSHFDRARPFGAKNASEQALSTILTACHVTTSNYPPCDSNLSERYNGSVVLERGIRSSIRPTLSANGSFHAGHGKMAADISRLYLHRSNGPSSFELTLGEQYIQFIGQATIQPSLGQVDDLFRSLDRLLTSSLPPSIQDPCLFLFPWW